MNNNETNKAGDPPSILKSLRSLLPARPLQLYEALRLAELQANRLLELSHIVDIPVPIEIVTDLPRIHIDYEIDMPASGTSVWDSQRKTWVITLNSLEPDTRHRLSILHEYKHIIDHGSIGLAPNRSGRSFYGLAPEEFLADYFAGCVLMPKRVLKRAWGDGIQHIVDLAELFDVSARAMQVRLRQVGLAVDTDRHERGRAPLRQPHARPARNPYQRALSGHWPIVNYQGASA